MRCCMIAQDATVTLMPLSLRPAASLVNRYWLRGASAVGAGGREVRDGDGRGAGAHGEEPTSDPFSAMDLLRCCNPSCDSKTESRFASTGSGSLATG